MAQVVVESPVGPLLLVARDGALTEIGFDGLDRARPDSVAAPPEDAAVLAAATVQLAEYFAGERREFDLPVRQFGTPFQEAVWEVLARIPWGTTTSYAAVARVLGMPVGAARAVGAANGANPVPVVVPCHRVIGSDGQLTGYGGGLDRKEALLRLEGVEIPGGQLRLFD